MSNDNSISIEQMQLILFKSVSEETLKMEGEDNKQQNKTYLDLIMRPEGERRGTSENCEF